MRVPSNDQVHIVDPLDRRQGVEVVPGHELVPVRHENLESLDIQHLLLRKVFNLGLGLYVVLVSADHDEFFGNVAEVVDRLLVTHISQANHAGDGARVEVLAELLGQVVALLGDVQVRYQQDEFKLISLRRCLRWSFSRLYFISSYWFRRA